MHISTLFGDYSIGSFSDNAKLFVDFLADCGFSYWQVLPFCPADEFNSPYKSYSSFAGNPYFVDLEKLHRKGLVTDSELEAAHQETPYSCEFEHLSENRISLLFTASERCKNRDEIESFIAENPYIENFCRFMALKHSNAEKCWIDWNCDSTSSDILFMWKFIQFEFFAQWGEIKDYANSRGIKVIGDLPFYVAYDSSDVYFSHSCFLLDRSGKPQCVAGVPPDYFSADGQLWGNPLYNWSEMSKNGYSWWCDRLSHMFSMFDAVRIDHFRAISSYWSVDADAKTAKSGHWEAGPAMDFINKINEIRGDKLIIAEDLGDIDDAVRKLVHDSGYPGMRVFQFGFLSDADSPHKPHNYTNNCVAYTGTHDNNTLLGYVWELDEKKRRDMLEYCGYLDPDWNRGYDSIIKTMLSSSAGIVIFPIQDILNFGSDTRLNIPGKAEGNWRFRITEEQLNSIDREKFKHLNKLYNRY